MRRHAVVAAVLAMLAGCETGEKPPPSYDLAAVPPVPPPSFEPAPAAPSERDCLAEAIYFEGRGEPREGQIAIAHVVMNRAAAKGFPGQVCDVIREGESNGTGKCQFSWRCDGKPDTPTDAAAWSTAQKVADSVMQGDATDPTHGALYFHNAKVQPDWSAKFRRTAEIGAHIYYAK
ncbi:cell wall hydrolase [Desertibaculum subflavum]|uniref:cell wall hydrolase n=1 Tax=Desertibaculum subflavum TaxID=2268458 RepID=UPI000E660B13